MLKNTIYSFFPDKQVQMIFGLKLLYGMVALAIIYKYYQQQKADV